MSEPCAAHHSPSPIVSSSAVTFAATPGRPDPVPSMSLRMRASLTPMVRAACERESPCR